MPGLWLGQAFGVFLLPGFGVGSHPQVPKHSTSMCDAGVKYPQIGRKEHPLEFLVILNCAQK